MKKGKMDEVLARFRARDRLDQSRAVRIYTSEVGAFNTIAFEAEFESPQEFESFLAGLPDPLNYLPAALLTDPRAPGHLVPWPEERAGLVLA